MDELPDKLLKFLSEGYLHGVEFFGFYKTCSKHRSLLNNEDLWERVITNYYGIDKMPRRDMPDAKLPLRDVFRHLREKFPITVLNRISSEFPRVEILEWLLNYRYEHPITHGEEVARFYSGGVYPVRPRPGLTYSSVKREDLEWFLIRVAESLWRYISCKRCRDCPLDTEVIAYHQRTEKSYLYSIQMITIWDDWDEGWPILR